MLQVKLIIQIFLSKSRRFLNLLLFLFISNFAIVSCKNIEYKKFASVEKVGNNSRNFIFSISEEFENLNTKIKKSKKNPKMNVGEEELLEIFLVDKKYCIDDENNLSYVIVSRQEKIYDVTFAHLIEQNYKAKPVSPIIYFGECK